MSEENKEQSPEEAQMEDEGGAQNDEWQVEEDPGPGAAESEGDQAGVQVGLSQLGPMIQVTAPDGTVAQKIVSVEECYLLAGQLLGLGGFVMNMSMQQSMQEQARIQQLLQQGGPEEKSKGGVYLKR